jgi:hypothetical protein
MPPFLVRLCKSALHETPREWRAGGGKKFGSSSVSAGIPWVPNRYNETENRRPMSSGVSGPPILPRWSQISGLPALRPRALISISCNVALGEPKQIKSILGILSDCACPPACVGRSRLIAATRRTQDRRIGEREDKLQLVQSALEDGGYFAERIAAKGAWFLGGQGSWSRCDFHYVRRVGPSW